MSKRCTIIHFEYGVFYSNEDRLKWISREEVTHTLAMRMSLEEVTYLGLVDAIRRKITVDEATTQLKISYIPMALSPKFPSYIMGDDDLYGYLMEVDKSGRRSVLHVEENIIDIETVQGCEENNEYMENRDCGLELVETNNGESVVGSVNPNDNDPLMMRYEDGTSVVNYDVVENGENVLLEEVRNTDDYGVVEVTHMEEGNQSESVEWEDGLGVHVGQEFECKEDVIDVFEKAAHKNCFQFDIIKSDTKLYVVKCRELKGESGCRWALRAAQRKNSKTFSIRTYNNKHTCSRSTTSTIGNKRRGTPRLVASIVREDYPGQFDTPTPNNLINIVQGRLGVKVSYSTAWRGKKLAANEVRGSPEESYTTLYSYMYMLEKTNPGTVTHIELDEEKKFKYLFFALGACIEGFEVMRKVIIVDGTHLKHAYGGVFIVATAQDPEHHHYPIAFDVVDGEKDASWSWFFQKLKEVVPDVPELVFTSDRNQSLIKSIREVYPLSRHGFCTYHLSQNMKAHVPNVHKDAAVKKFQECAKAYTEVEFHKLYGEFSELYPAAAEYLHRSVDPCRWARCYFSGDRYNIDTSNQVESINGVFVKARMYALQPMIDVILRTLAKWFNNHRKSVAEASSGQKLVPIVDKELHDNIPQASLLEVEELNNYFLEYSVTGRDGKKYLVDLETRSCSCKRFDKDKYPCVHGIAAAVIPREKEIPLGTLCSKYYLIEWWTHAYIRTIYLVPHKTHWMVPNLFRELVVIPPDHENKPGRTQTTRFPSVGEPRQRRSSKKVQ